MDNQKCFLTLYCFLRNVARFREKRNYSFRSRAAKTTYARSSAASNQTAKIPDQVRNDDISVAPHYVLGSPERGAVRHEVTD